MPSSKEGLEVEIKKLLSEIVSSIDILSSLEVNKGNVTSTIKDVAMLNKGVIGKICKEAIVTMRKGVESESALSISLRKNEDNLKSREVINLFKLISESNRSTRHLLKEYPYTITEEFTHLVRFKIKKIFDKLTILLALSFLLPVILALITLFHRFGMLDVILVVLIFQLLLRSMTRLVFRRDFRVLSVLSMIVFSFLPIPLAFIYVLLNGILRVTFYSFCVLMIYRHITFKSKEIEEHTDLSEELLYFELIKGLNVGKSVEQTIIESVKRIPSTKRERLMNIICSFRTGKGLQRSNLMKLGFGISTAIKASLKGRSVGGEALNKLLKIARVKRELYEEIKLELKTINFRAKVTSFIILISLVILTFTNIYLLPIGYNKLRILCLTYMNSALLFNSSIEFFSLLFVRRRVLKWGFLQLFFFFVILSILSIILLVLKYMS